MMMTLQSGMKEEHTGEVCLKGADPDAVEALLFYMYGKLRQVPDKLLLPLFVLADLHQVGTLRAQQHASSSNACSITAV